MEKHHQLLRDRILIIITGPAKGLAKAEGSHCRPVCCCGNVIARRRFTWDQYQTYYVLVWFRPYSSEVYYCKGTKHTMFWHGLDRMMTC